MSKKSNPLLKFLVEAILFSMFLAVAWLFLIPLDQALIHGDIHVSIFTVGALAFYIFIEFLIFGFVVWVLTRKL